MRDLRATRLAGTLQAKVAEESQSLIADLREAGVQSSAGRHAPVRNRGSAATACALRHRRAERQRNADTSAQQILGSGALKRFNPAQFGDFPAAARQRHFLSAWPTASAMARGDRVRHLPQQLPSPATERARPPHARARPHPGMPTRS